ncbi:MULTISPECIES: glucose 1-dehydrogenase [unclassified Paraburkholderia]|uniref:SDR family NAD(P)-dependent oxidoreductase n=1 Tax=unclassified Paraburkholderia TaxID=2615204 RepID=UPI002AB094CE|nr:MULTISPECIES: glucose 1-dehydrogenase [unclassified Paraburkholderia]
MLENKIIIVTGGGSGIGRATSRILARNGAKVVVADFNQAGAAETAAAIEAEGGVAKSLKVDVADEASVVEMVNFTVGSFGRLDGAFNNAGLQMQNKLLEDLTEAEWHRVVNVNLTGVFLCMKHEILAMRKTGGGAIVNTSSANGIVANPYSSEYVASKHGVLGATRAAACEAAITGVRVNAVLPGMINTPMIADLINSPDFKVHYDAALARHTIGRFGEPEDVGYAVKFLLSNESSFVNGAGFTVDGGYTAR